ncbi:MAG: 3'(2'),5'-bisphosphate nucleotidase CysQ [Acidimicrobiales bacterium]|nr:3'(2'),5'-bisphosphate nucleotidase CysQ [Acidimicrobiales bacterium]
MWEFVVHRSHPSVVAPADPANRRGCYTVGVPAPTDDDHALAARLADEAGALLMDLRAERTADGDFDPRELKDDGDLRSHELLMAALAPRIEAGDAVLSEEGRDSTDRLAHARVWIIDPLDGTREFGEPPRTDWAVHVALSIEGAPVCGAVALPGLDRVLSTAEPPSVLDLDEVPGRPRVVVSRTRPPAAATWVADHLDAELVEMGSAGAKVAAVVQGLADVYPHSGGQYEWDSCAPVAVAAAAGLVATRLDGAELRYNEPDPYLPDLLVCHRALAERSRSIIDAWLADGGR